MSKILILICVFILMGGCVFLGWSLPDLMIGKYTKIVINAVIFIVSLTGILIIQSNTTHAYYSNAEYDLKAMAEARNAKIVNVDNLSTERIVYTKCFNIEEYVYYIPTSPENNEIFKR